MTWLGSPEDGGAKPTGQMPLWQAEHTPLDICLLRPDGEAAKPWLTYGHGGAALYHVRRWIARPFYLAAHDANSIFSSRPVRLVGKQHIGPYTFNRKHPLGILRPHIAERERNLPVS